MKAPSPNGWAAGDFLSLLITGFLIGLQYIHEGSNGVNGWGEKKNKGVKGREWGERKNPQLPEPDQQQKCAHLFQGILSRDVAPTEQAWIRQDEGRGEMGDPTPDISKPSLHGTVSKINMKCVFSTRTDVGLSYFGKSDRDNRFRLLFLSFAATSKLFDWSVFKKCFLISQIMASLYVLVIVNYIVSP